MSYAVGSLVHARGRDWVVLPDSSDDIVMVRPLGGTEAEAIGILPDLEVVEPATFAPPSLDDRGDFASARLLRDALRLGFRSSSGPFRSFGELAFEPRPYQLVPLLMSLRQETVRLMIADDVGIGKTVEAGLIAKELLATGAARRLAVLCPPHLAEQWQRELSEKFHLDAQLVLASTASRLERNLVAGESLFEHHPITIVSLDFIKSARRRDDFVRACPDLVIVDEAHTCADTGSGARHLRYDLLRSLAGDPERHMLLVTATPHSGKDDAFRSLLALLSDELATLPEDMSGDHNRAKRELLAKHLVQRRRGDVAAYVGDTPFPEREIAEHAYKQKPEYAAFLRDVLEYAREQVREPGSPVRQRVRWWAALGLLRAISSSPAAAAATLRTRAANAAAQEVDEADTLGRDLLFDPGEVSDEAADSADTVFGSVAVVGPDGEEIALDPRLAAFAERAEALKGDGDAKLAAALKHTKKLLDDGYQPILFCRYIETAKYLAAHLDKKLNKKITVECVTGELPPSEREDRIVALGDAEQRVLVATDCLSEGINLQHLFDAVVHYDLPWNPTRLEQREGRVDRFGQARETVRVLTMSGDDNLIDNIVRDVLIRKHRAIRKALGVSIPVPGTVNDVMEELATKLFVSDTNEQTALDLGIESARDFESAWQTDADREKRSRALYAQHSIQVEEVAAEVEAARNAVGGELDVSTFVTNAVYRHGGFVEDEKSGAQTLLLSEAPLVLRDRFGLHNDTVTVAFQQPAPAGATLLNRTHPIVAALAGHVLDTALDPTQPGVAARTGIIRSQNVSNKTTVVLARFRHQLVAKRKNRSDHPMLAETAAVLAFEGAPDSPRWIDSNAAEAALNAVPSSGVTDALAERLISQTLEALPTWRDQLNEQAVLLAEQLADAHQRVRDEGKVGGSVEVNPTLPVDVLGVYVVLPEVAQ